MIAIGILEVQGPICAVVAADERDPGFAEHVHHRIESSAVGNLKGKMGYPQGIPGRPHCRFTDFLESDGMVFISRGKERKAAHALGQAQTQLVDVERHRSVEITHTDMDVTELQCPRSGRKGGLFIPCRMLSSSSSTGCGNAVLFRSRDLVRCVVSELFDVHKIRKRMG